MKIVIFMMTIMFLACTAITAKNLSDETVVLSTVKNIFGDSVTGIIIETLPDGTLIITDLKGRSFAYQKEIIQSIDHKTISVVSVVDKPVFTNKTLFTLVDGSTLEGYVLHASPDKHYSVLLADGSVTTIETGAVSTMEIKTTPISIDDYNRLKKSPTIAFFLNIIPGFALGHAYAGDWGRGMKYEGSEALLLAAGLGVGLAGQFVGFSALTILIPAVVTFLVIDIGQAVDAASCVKEYNRKLKTHVSSPTTSLLFRQNEKTSEIGLTLSF